MMPHAKMDCRLFSIVLLSVVLTVSCRSLESSENATTSLLDVAEGLFRTGRARSNLLYANLVSCAIRYDTSCFMDAAGDYFEQRKNELLAEADSEFLKSTGRADPETAPSHVAKSIEKLLSELSGIFKDSLLNFFGAREGEEEDEVVDSDGQANGTSRAVKEDRTIKKKKDQIMRYVKLGIIAAIIKYKISLFIKLFMAAVLTKIFFLVLSNLLLNTVRLFIDLKKSSEPHKNIYYEHSQHDHHYDGEPWHEEEGFWGR